MAGRRRILLLFVFLAGVAVGAILANTFTIHFLSDVQDSQRRGDEDTKSICDCPRQDSVTVSATSPPPVSVVATQLTLDQLKSDFTNRGGPIRVQYGARSLAKGSVLVAVMTSEGNIARASSVYSSWTAEASEVILFVGENCCAPSVETQGLPIIKLRGVRDEASVSFEKTAAALKFIEHNHQGTYRWLLKVSDDAYVNMRRMDELLAQFNPLLPQYLGNRRDGPQTAAYCCEEAAGVVLSASVVNSLVPVLGECGSRLNSEGLKEDEVLGRCVMAAVSINCTQLHSSYLEQHNTPSSSSSILPSLKSDPAYRNAVAVYHITKPEDMSLLHWYYQREEHHLLRERMDSVEQQLDALCIQLLIEDCRPRSMVETCSQQSITCSPHVDLPSPPPTSPHTLEDMVSWDFLDKGALYNDRSIYPSHAFRVMEPRKHEMKALNAEVTKEASRQYGKPLRFRKIVGGYTRYSPLVGVEYIMDAVFLDRSALNSAVNLRVRLVRPLAPNYIAQQESSDSSAIVNVIMPVSNVESRFAGFLEMYENVALKNHEPVRLILVTYGEEGVAFVNRVMQPFVARNADFRFTVVKGEGAFTRAQSVHLGMSQLGDADLAFVCDVDMEIKNHFFNRCRRNPVRGKRVFFPEFFKTYNLDFVNRHKEGTPPKDSIIRSYGHWASYSYGMMCIFKSDYLAVGGMKMDIVGWGDEDVEFYERVLDKSLEVIRAPDTGLFHRWHEKECPASLPATQYQHCLSSKAENLADRMELANYIFELQQNRTTMCT